MPLPRRPTRRAELVLALAMAHGIAACASDAGGSAATPAAAAGGAGEPASGPRHLEAAAPRASTLGSPVAATVADPWQGYRDAASRNAGGLGYLVEWDLWFATEDALRAHYDNLQTFTPALAVFHDAAGYEPTFGSLDQLHIRYCVSNLFTNKAAVVSDIALATRAWEDVANLDFQYESSLDVDCNPDPSGAEFAVVPTSGTFLVACGTNKLEKNFLGGGGSCLVRNETTLAQVYGVLAIDYGQFPQPGASSGLTPAGVMRHELGHILGFKHEHPWSPVATGCTGEDTSNARYLTAPFDPDGDSFDQHSVMLIPSCNGNAGADYSVSALDGLGARRIYGPPAAWLGIPPYLL